MGWKENFQSIGGHPAFKDITGQRFGVVVVQSRASNDGAGNARWHCKCDECGQSHILRGTRLRAKASKRCPEPKEPSS